MKKTLWLALVLLMVCVFAFSACDNGDTPSNDDNGNSQQTTEENGENNSSGENSNTPVVCQHTFGSWNTIKQATCKEEGKLVRTCSKCSEAEESTIPKTDIHIEVVDAAIPATCTTNGLTEGKHCSVCNTVTVAQTTVKANGHSNGAWITDFEATCTKEGSKHQICSVCAATIKTEKIAKKAHTEAIDSAVAATCTTDGKTEGKHCSECSKILIDQNKITAKGHTGDICSVCGNNAVDFAGGAGTSSSPYLVSNSKHLNNIRNYDQAYFTLINDIVFSNSNFTKNGEFYNDGNLWDPIYSFSGHFDGQGYAIYNLRCNRSHAGLFWTNKGIIQNVRLVDVNFSSDVEMYAFAGGIAILNEGTIEYSSVSGSIRARASSNEYSTETRVGGIVAKNMETGIIRFCYNLAYVGSESFSQETNTKTPYAYAGGIASQNDGTISNSYNHGKVDAVSAANWYSNEYRATSGGIAACNTSSGKISCCYNIGEIGSFYDYGYGSTYSRAYCYSYGIALNNTYIKGKITNCYYSGLGDLDPNGIQNSVWYDMKSKATYVGFDFENIWEIDPTKSEYPILK